MTTTTLVAEYLQQDHRRLDGLLDEAIALVRGGDFARARGFFKEFVDGLRRHIRMEEEVLFPAFEQATGMHGFGPTQVMRLEHLEITAILDALARSLEVEDGKDFDERVGRLHVVLGDHNRKEELVVYPQTDQSLPDGHREELIRRMQAL